MQEEIVINVQFDTKVVDDAKTKLAASVGAVNDLKKAQSELTKAIKDQGYATKEQATQLAQIQKELEAETRAQKSNTAVVQAATLAQYDSNASLDDQRQYLNTLQKAVASMTKEQMEMMGGQQALQEQIKKVSDAVKEQEQAMGDSRRNVGNYTESILAAGAKSHDLADAFKVSSVAATGLGKATDSVDKAMKLAAKNPWMAVLSLLLPIIQKLFQGLSKNEAVMKKVKEMIDRLKNAFKQFEPIIRTIADLYTKVLVKAFDVVMKAIKKVLQIIDKLAKKVGYDLNLSSAFEQSGKASTQAAETIEKSDERIVRSEKKKDDSIIALREEMERRRRTNLENEIADLEKKRDAELATAKLTADEKLEIEKYYNDQIAAARDAAAAEEQKRIDEEAKKKEEAKRAKLEARNKARQQFGLEEGQTPEEAELQLLAEARQQDLLNDEEYEVAKTMITEKYSKQRQDAIEAEVQKATQLYEKEMKTAGSSAAGAMNALSELVGAFAEDSEEAQNAQKAFAFGSILINQAMAIAEGAKGIAAAMAGAAEAAAATGPAAPVMLGVYTAQMVGQVLALVASVSSTIVQAKQIFAQSDTQKFASGGIVGGSSYTGDKVPALLNSREMVLNMDSQKQLFDALSSGDSANRTLGIDYGLMAQAVAAMPAPIVDYTEMQQFGQKVATYKEIASI